MWVVKKPVFKKGKEIWIDKISKVIKIFFSTKVTQIQALKITESEIYNNRRVKLKQQTNFKVEDSVRKPKWHDTVYEWNITNWFDDL